MKKVIIAIGIVIAVAVGFIAGTMVSKPEVHTIELSEYIERVYGEDARIDYENSWIDSHGDLWVDIIDSDKTYCVTIPGYTIDFTC